MARACGSYPQCRWFDSDCRYHSRSQPGWVPGPVVKRLRHRPFTAVTRVRFSSGSPYARIAQLVRALASHARGQRFESVYAHQQKRSTPTGCFFFAIVCNRLHAADVRNSRQAVSPLLREAVFSAFHSFPVQASRSKGRQRFESGGRAKFALRRAKFALQAKLAIASEIACGSWGNALSTLCVHRVSPANGPSRASSPTSG